MGVVEEVEVGREVGGGSGGSRGSGGGGGRGGKGGGWR